MRSTTVSLLVGLVLSACTGGHTTTGDASPQDSPAIDSHGADVADTVSEHIASDVPLDQPAESGSCANPDMDHDGHRSIACGGDDCDDNDPNRFPGNTEVCLVETVAGGDAGTDAGADAHADAHSDAHADASADGGTPTQYTRTDPAHALDPMHDEDCDPTTFANAMTHDGDHDGDGFIDVACGNTDHNGAVYRGTDCVDLNPVAAMPSTLGATVPPGDVHPMQVEICNGVDDNCNGMIDEGDPGGGGSCGLAAENVCRMGVNQCVMGALVCQVDFSTQGYCCTGFQDCNNDTRDGCEANLTIDANNCGACGHVCPSTGGAPVCSGGMCGYSTCGAGLTLCNGTCVDTTSDPNNCNGCAHVCPTASGAPSCTGGMCGYSSCAGGLTLCGSSCVDATTDINNCGGCGHGCTAPSGGTALCVSSSCTGTCPGSEALCGTTCINTTTDLNNCGACGRACPGITNGYPTCAGGSCGTACNGGYSMCASGCASTSSDPNNCGYCGNVCPGTSNGYATCNGGSCGLACGGGFQLCGGACVSVNDVNNCGSCGNVCPSGGSCNGGVCGCPSGQESCPVWPSGATCSDPNWDMANCGYCGHVCYQPIVGGWAACDSGSCCSSAGQYCQFASDCCPVPWSDQTCVNHTCGTY